ncbi:MAG: DnaJ domain-containing protein [Candidatus Edwardsbacteria bacterium]
MKRLRGTFTWFSVKSAEASSERIPRFARNRLRNPFTQRLLPPIFIGVAMTRVAILFKYPCVIWDKQFSSLIDNFAICHEMSFRDYYSILGVAREAPATEISRAYRNLVRQYQPGSQNEFAPELDEINKAYAVLGNKNKRREYDRCLKEILGVHTVEPAEHHSEAESAYQQGLEAMERNDYRRATELFAKAARLEPNQGHYHSQWGLALSLFRGKFNEAERHCKHAIELEPNNPQYHFNLGFLYQHHNLTDLAQAEFDEAERCIQVRQEKFQKDLTPILITPPPPESITLEEIEQPAVKEEEIPPSTVSEEEFQKDSTSSLITALPPELIVSQPAEQEPVVEKEETLKEILSLPTSRTGSPVRTTPEGISPVHMEKKETLKEIVSPTLGEEQFLIKEHLKTLEHLEFEALERLERLRQERDNLEEEVANLKAITKTMEAQREEIDQQIERLKGESDGLTKLVEAQRGILANLQEKIQEKLEIFSSLEIKTQ